MTMGRRQVLQVGAGSLLGLVAARMLRPGSARATTAPLPAATARSVIVLWMNGGPSHVDTWDPKPGTSGGGPWKAIATKIPGVQISEHLPLVAAASQHIAILRGLSTREGNHQRAQLLLHTGYTPNPTVAYPSLGGWVSEELGDPASDLPAFVAVSGPSVGAGFLGVEHGPFIVERAGVPPADTSLPRDVDGARFDRRRGALAVRVERFAAQTGDRKVKSRRGVYDKAVRMMASPGLKTFDLSSEPPSLASRYGDSDFGRGCLLARRLVEAGVKYVEVTLDGWDTHKDNHERCKAQMQVLDPALATLLADLDERHLLASTLVVCVGDFGRTPTINAADGRDHYPQAFSAVLAGGGVHGGIAWGKTDAEGAHVIERPTTVADLFATLATLLGMNPDKQLDTPVGRPVSITQSGTPIQELIKI